VFHLHLVSAAMLHGFVRGKWSLEEPAFLLGLGEPGNWARCAKATAEWFPAGQRALVIASSTPALPWDRPCPAGCRLPDSCLRMARRLRVIGSVGLGGWWRGYSSISRRTKIDFKPEEYLEIKDHVRPPARPLRPRGSVNWRKVIGMRECYTLILARFFTDPVTLLHHFLAADTSVRAPFRSGHGRKIRLGAVHLRGIAYILADGFPAG